MRALKYLLLAGALVVAIEAPKPFLEPQAPIAAPVRVAYGPAPGFESLDPNLIAQARRTIDMTAYVLSDERVIEALSAAASRGVKIRIYFDPEQFRRIGGRNDNVIALVNQPSVQAQDQGRAERPDAFESLCDRRALAAHGVGQFLLVRRKAPGQ